MVERPRGAVVGGCIFLFGVVALVLVVGTGGGGPGGSSTSRGESASAGHSPVVGAHGEVAYLEPFATNPTRAALQMCQEHTAYNDSAAFRERAARVAEVNKGTLNSESLLAKVQVWHSPPSPPVAKAAAGVSSAGTRLVGGSSPKLMCVVLGLEGRPGEAEWSQRLWAHKCDKQRLFTSSDYIPGVDPSNIIQIQPLGGNTLANGWQRLRSAVKAFSRNDLASHDFFLITGDESYVIVENLRKMIAEPEFRWLAEMGTPMIIGHRMVTTAGVPFVSGAGFVMNSAAMTILSVAVDEDVCKPKTEGLALDLSLAECMRDFGVAFFDSSDELGEDRIHVFNPTLLAGVLKEPEKTAWYPSYHQRPLPKGLDAVSEYSILFNYINPHLAHTIHSRVFK